MIRRRQVYPDASGVVTREALLEAMIDAATFLDFAGGVLSVVTQRQPTGLPGEMVTVGAIVEWRHDARVEPKPQQFEQATQPDFTEAKLPVTAEQQQAMIREATEQIKAEDALVAQADALADVDPADGFDYSQLDEEDVEAPVAAS